VLDVRENRRTRGDIDDRRFFKVQYIILYIHIYIITYINIYIYIIIFRFTMRFKKSCARLHSRNLDVQSEAFQSVRIFT
jgi:hypothetical protein